MSSSLFRSKAVEFQNNRLHGDILILPQVSHALVVIFILAWVIVTIVWLATSNYSRKETVLGWLEPPTGVVRVYPEDAIGKIHQVLVTEGQNVKVGQALVAIKVDRTLDSGEHLESMLLNEYEQQQLMLSNQKVRAHLIYNIQLEDVNQQIKSSSNDLTLIGEQISTIKQRQSLLNKRTNHYKKMNENGYVSEADIDASLEQELSLTSDLQALLRNQENQKDRIKQLYIQLQLLPQNYEDDKTQLQTSLSNLSQTMTRLRSQQAYVIKATSAGIITNLQVRAGQQPNINSPIMTIIPETEEIEAHLLIPVRSAGFLTEGQNIDVRYDAFPYQKFGLYSGHIISISESVLLPNEVYSAPLSISEPVYLVRAKLNQQSVNAYGKRIVLKSGMTLSADVTLSNRSILEWVLEPILSLKGRI